MTGSILRILPVILNKGGHDLKKWSAFLSGFEKLMCVCLGMLMIILVCDVTLQVIARYLFSAPPSWTEELARRLMQLIVFFGSGIAYRKSEMTGITLLVERMPEKLQKACSICMNGAILVFCLFLTYIGYKMCIQVGGQLSPALRLPKWLFYAAIPFFGITTAFFAAEKIMKTIRNTEEDFA